MELQEWWAKRLAGADEQWLRLDRRPQQFSRAVHAEFRSGQALIAVLAAMAIPLDEIARRAEVRFDELRME